MDEIVPDFVDPATDGPRAGREEQWSLVTEYRVRLAREERNWGEAERLQLICVEWDRQRAAEALDRAPEALDAGEKNTIRTLAASLHDLGQIQREQGHPECAQSYEEAAEMARRAGDRQVEAIAAFNLGYTYMDLPALRDLDQAERWYRRSLELLAEGDRLGRGKCYVQLGTVARQRLADDQKARAEESVLLVHLNAAAGFYHQALALLPPDAVNDLAVLHNQLGIIYRNAGALERALEHYNKSIHYSEIAGNLHEAGKYRRNVTLALANAGRLSDALLYARAALRNFEPYGAGAAQDIQDTQRLIAEIEQLMQEKGVQ